MYQQQYCKLHDCTKKAVGILYIVYPLWLSLSGKGRTKYIVNNKLTQQT